MTRSLCRASHALGALLAVAFVSGCYTAAHPPHAYRSGDTSHGYARYETPSGFFGIAVYTSPPRSHGHDGSIWYYGNHPHPANHSLGSFCRLHDSHRHDYAPYHSHRYAFHDDHYFWVGDANRTPITTKATPTTATIRIPTILVVPVGSAAFTDTPMLQDPPITTV